LVLSGDHPLITSELISELLATHEEAGAGATVMTAELDEPGSYGRIVRGDDGDIEQIVEAKQPGDATPEQLTIREINTGTYAFAATALVEALGQISNENSQGEYFLGDVLPIIRAAGHRVAAHLTADPMVNLGVNTRAELAIVERTARERILDHHMRDGVTITDPGSTWIDADVELEADARIEPGTTIQGASSVGADSVVGPHTTLINSRLGREVKVPHSYLTDCDVLDRCTVGPFAYIRPGTKLREGAKAGTFVEIKNSDVGAGSKVPHLSYIGDTEIGEDSNIGAGAITANYDGYLKHRTVIGDRVQIGVDTALVAPVDVGDAAYTGAGSVITKNVPPGALGISRAQQRKIEGYAERRAREASEEGEES
jgi:bifunctional UDP-N-acetylglucosamine pyrophosphorylase/glucosamine-1-phosphate N-acetyltransferase